jgi:hypothetical protein
MFCHVAIVSVILSTVALCASAKVAGHNIPDCGPAQKAQIGDVCRVTDLMSLRPTQFVVGYIEIACRITNIERLFAKGSSHLDTYLARHQVPVVASAGDQAFFVVDHHHLISSMMSASIPDSERRVYINVTDTYSHVASENSFWSSLINNGNAYTGFHGSSIPPNLLPKSIDLLLNDVWRGLCYFVRHFGGYLAMPNPPYAYPDFQWAVFFRANLAGPPSIASSAMQAYCNVNPYATECIGNITLQKQWLNATLPLALKLAQSSRAQNLPGFGMGVVDPPNCDM